MASYSVEIAASAVEDLLAVPFPFRRQINQRIHKLKLVPRPGAAQVILDDDYRVLVAGWWIVYTVDDDRNLVTVLAIPPAET